MMGAMLGVPDISVRRVENELMDDPGLEPARHERALRGLSRINKVSGTAWQLWRELRRPAMASAAPLRVLDVASGGGDVLLRVWRRARRSGVDLQAAGCDVSRRSVAFSLRRAARHSTSIRFFECDVLRDPLPTDYDAIVCCLFLHHLRREEAVGLLRSMGEAAGRMVLVCDLNRCVGGYAAAWAAPRVLTRSAVVHTDAVRSVRSAYTMQEARELASEAGLAGAEVRRAWPWRWMLRWQR